jgi:ArsR family transcriptional regulator
MPQPLVSHHLKVLVEAGLVTARRADGFTMYALDPDGMAAARAATGELLDPEALAAVAYPGGNEGCCR